MPKLLIVGSVDRMDATLEAAHMQGPLLKEGNMSALEVLKAWTSSCDLL